MHHLKKVRLNSYRDNGSLNIVPFLTLKYKSNRTNMCYMYMKYWLHIGDFFLVTGDIMIVESVTSYVDLFKLNMYNESDCIAQ